jgi:hypothetical protein
MSALFNKRTWSTVALVVILPSLALLGGTALAQGAPPGLERDSSAPWGPAGVPIGSAHFGLNWSVIASGGGALSSPHFRLSSTLGQPATGAKGGANFGTCTGFWCGLDFVRDLFLPLLLGDS